MQQQDGGVDCGLFTIAFATELAYGNDPVWVSYICAEWFAVTSVVTGTTTTVWESKKETCLNSGSASYARVPRAKDINS